MMYKFDEWRLAASDLCAFFIVASIFMRAFGFDEMEQLLSLFTPVLVLMVYLNTRHLS